MRVILVFFLFAFLPKFGHSQAYNSVNFSYSPGTYQGASKVALTDGLHFQGTFKYVMSTKGGPHIRVLIDNFKVTAITLNGVLYSDGYRCPETGNIFNIPQDKLGGNLYFEGVVKYGAFVDDIIEFHNAGVNIKLSQSSSTAQNVTASIMSETIGESYMDKAKLQELIAKPNWQTLWMESKVNPANYFGTTQLGVTKYEVSYTQVSRGLTTEDYLKKLLSKCLENKDEEKEESGEDDFWNGEEEVDESDNEDDFWNGEDNKGENENEDDFWSGNGTIEDAIELEKEKALATGDQYIGHYESSTKYITVKCRDHGEIDGDRVRIYHNGSVIEYNLTLDSYFSTIDVTLSEGINKISFEALNNGDSGNNTATFVIEDNYGQVLYSNGWSINRGYKGTLLIIKN